MENNVGVGIIVGLTFTSSLYVWSSDSFTKEQKTGLLVCIIFPPAQWLGILIVLAYNSSKRNNSVEKVEERKGNEAKTKLDSTISNLTELKEKGILTEEEYKTKIEKIETEKAEQNLKNSIEYKQLKSLLDSGVLTKDEFENKIQLLQNVSEKDIDVIEINKILDSATEKHLEYTKEVNESPKSSLKKVYIFSILFFVVLIGILLTFSSSKNSSNYNNTKPAVDPLEVTVDTNINHQEVIKNKKFVYIIFKIDAPKLDIYKPISIQEPFDFTPEPEPSFSTDYESETLVTNIVEIEDFNEDNKNRLIDSFDNELSRKLDTSNYIYQSDILVNCKDEARKYELEKERAKVVNTEVFEFDTYSEASVSKRNK